MRGWDGSPLGYIGVMSRRRLEASEEEVATLRIFGQRAAAEIERGRHEIALREREAEVAASRARVVHAADDERERIERNLHDGAQQRLLALTHMLSLAQRKLETSPEDAATLVSQAPVGGEGRVQRGTGAGARAAPGRAHHAGAAPSDREARGHAAGATRDRGTARAAPAQGARGHRLLLRLGGRDRRRQARSGHRRARQTWRSAGGRSI